jgi:hypothetical protein
MDLNHVLWAGVVLLGLKMLSDAIASLARSTKDSAREAALIAKDAAVESAERIGAPLNALVEVLKTCTYKGPLGRAQADTGETSRDNDRDAAKRSGGCFSDLFGTRS